MRQSISMWIAVITVAYLLLGCGGNEGRSDRSDAVLKDGLPGERAVPRVRRGRTAPTADSVDVHPLVRRQILYVPAYAHIFFRDERRSINLATTLSIHNTDPDRAIQLTAVEYYSSEGELVRRHLEEPRTLGPFASTWYVIEESDLSGGVGANFIVEWESSEPVSPPVVETVMISTAQQQGISFTSQARVLEQE